MIAEPPVRLDASLEVLRSNCRVRRRFEDREAFSQEILKVLRVADRGEPPEDQRATGRDFHGIETRIQCPGFDAEELTTHGNADRTSVPVVSPMMKAAHDGAVALVGVAQWKGTVGTAVFESRERIPETLNEDGARRERRSEPIAVLADVRGQTQEGPRAREPGLLAAKRRRMDERIRPVRERAHFGGPQPVD
jgi:hypothetical protein